jgi:hypothetical protein
VTTDALIVDFRLADTMTGLQVIGKLRAFLSQVRTQRRC